MREKEQMGAFSINPKNLTHFPFISLLECCVAETFYGGIVWSCGGIVLWSNRFLVWILCGGDVLWRESCVVGAFCNGTLSGENFFTGDRTTFSDRTFWAVRTTAILPTVILPKTTLYHCMRTNKLCTVLVNLGRRKY